MSVLILRMLLFRSAVVLLDCMIRPGVVLIFGDLPARIVLLTIDLSAFLRR